jgi:hypothetical protein
MEDTSPVSYNCFTILPFTDTSHSARGGAKVEILSDQWKHIFTEWIKKAVESYPAARITCKCSATSPGNFIKGIIQDIDGSSLVIADLTGNRPNVYYELGIRHALRTGTIIITQDFSALPSDLRSYHCFEYTYTEKAHEYSQRFATFEHLLHQQIEAVISNGFASDSPVSDFLGGKRYSEALSFEARKQKLIYTIEELKRSVERTPAEFDGLKKADSVMGFKAGLSIIFDIALLNAVYLDLLLDFDWKGFSPMVRDSCIQQIGTARTTARAIGALGQYLQSSDVKALMEPIANLRASLEKLDLPARFCELIDQIRAFSQ